MFQSKLLGQPLPRCGLWFCGYCGKSFSNQEVCWSQCCGILAVRNGPRVDCGFNADQGGVQLFFGEPWLTRYNFTLWFAFQISKRLCEKLVFFIKQLPVLLIRYSQKIFISRLFFNDSWKQIFVSSKLPFLSHLLLTSSIIQHFLWSFNFWIFIVLSFPSL